jgi:hypothetical protein
MSLQRKKELADKNNIPGEPKSFDSSGRLPNLKKGDLLTTVNNKELQLLLGKVELGVSLVFCFVLFLFFLFFFSFSFFFLFFFFCPSVPRPVCFEATTATMESWRWNVLDKMDPCVAVEDFLNAFVFPFSFFSFPFNKKKGKISFGLGLFWKSFLVGERPVSDCLSRCGARFVSFQQSAEGNHFGGPLVQAQGAGG